jgi:hypothetical protein
MQRKPMTPEAMVKRAQYLIDENERLRKRIENARLAIASTVVDLHALAAKLRKAARE